MARLDVQSDLLVPGSWVLRSDHPGVLASVSDAVVQTLGLEGEALAAWALHYDEQDLHAEDAYARERQELGMHAQAQIVVRPTPARPNVVYVDRLHLVAVAAPPAAGSRLAGLYVGTQGDLVLSVHHPSVTMQVGSSLLRLPELESARDGNEVVATSRFVVSFDRRDPTAVRVRAPQPMALAVQDAITRLQGMVVAW